MTIQQYGGVVADGQFQATTTGGLVSTRAAAVFANPLPPSVWGYALTNNDSTIDVFVGYGPVTATNYYRKLSAGQTWEVSADVGAFNKLQIVSASGTPNVHLTVFR